MDGTSNGTASHPESLSPIFFSFNKLLMPPAAEEGNGTGRRRYGILPAEPKLISGQKKKSERRCGTLSLSRTLSLATVGIQLAWAGLWPPPLLLVCLCSHQQSLAYSIRRKGRRAVDGRLLLISISIFRPTSSLDPFPFIQPTNFFEHAHKMHFQLGIRLEVVCSFLRKLATQPTLVPIQIAHNILSPSLA
jgi:hypothetical protein